jgi:phosphoribosyl-ATP pyrophosphohydrolase/phosphoribosyl-AMP cyclohydrolase
MTDRTLRVPTDFDGLAFTDLDGLIPVVAQDDRDGRVLMVAFANRQALEASLSTREVHFWSRSRKTLWKKGETSGNVLRLVSLHADCDGDTVLARVRPTGPACHTGDDTCFGEGADPTEALESPADATLAALDLTMAIRQSRRPEGSYTVRLLDDENLRLKKLGEETAELVTALAKGDRDRIPEEAADLLYHMLAALRGASVPLAAVMTALEARRR